MGLSDSKAMNSEQFQSAETSNLVLRKQLVGRLQQLIKESGLSQREIAKLLNVKQPRIAEIMSSKIEYFSVDTLLKYIEQLGDKVTITTTGKQSPAAALSLIESWMNEDSSYDETTWPELKKQIEENRLSDRKRFRE